MTLTAFFLVGVATVLHACWNLAAKRASGNLGGFWLALCFAGLLLIPVVGLAGLPVDLAGLPYIIATGLIHTAYFSLLTANMANETMEESKNAAEIPNDLTQIALTADSFSPWTHSFAKRAGATPTAVKASNFDSLYNLAIAGVGLA